MGYQICPLCKGSGHIGSTDGMKGIKKCTVCDGKQIINEATGKPPAEAPKVEEPKKRTDADAKIFIEEIFRRATAKMKEEEEKKKGSWFDRFRDFNTDPTWP